MLIRNHNLQIIFLCGIMEVFSFQGLQIACIFLGKEKVSLLERCPHFRGVLRERCPRFRGVLRERCPRFRGVLRERFHLCKEQGCVKNNVVQSPKVTTKWPVKT